MDSPQRDTPEQYEYADLLRELYGCAGVMLPQSGVPLWNQHDLGMLRVTVPIIKEALEIRKRHRQQAFEAHQRAPRPPQPAPQRMQPTPQPVTPWPDAEAVYAFRAACYARYREQQR
jgi:hypothetical protein